MHQKPSGMESITLLLAGNHFFHSSISSFHWKPICSTGYLNSYTASTLYSDNGSAMFLDDRDELQIAQCPLGNTL
jgi:hypothetical protein